MMPRYTRYLLFVTAVSLLPYCQGQTLNLVNGDFELDGPVISPPTGWTLDVGEVYVTSGMDLSPIDPTSAFSGNNFVTMNRLAAGDTFSNAAQAMSMYQTVNVSAFAYAIDIGDRFVDLSFAYNAADPSDNGVVSIGFMDAGGSTLGSEVNFNTIFQPTPDSVWTGHSLFGQVPSGTRSIQFSLASELTANGVGTARNVSFDDLAATLVDEPEIAPRDVVHANLIQFADNGAWSWFQDERAIVDQQHGELIFGYIANRDGVGGESVDGQVKTTHFDLGNGSRRHYIHNDIESYGAGDDHNLPGLLQKSDGNILAFYAAHNNRSGVEDDRSYYRTYDPESEVWGEESEYHWWDVIPANAPGSGGTTYSNVFQLAAEDPDGDGNGRLYNIARTQQSPHIMYSDDNGATWEYGGQFTKQNSTPPASSYVNGYYKYSSNGVDRVDFIATEYHPRDYNTSIYHAYIQDGKMYDSDGNDIDADIFDAASSFDANIVPSTDDFTKIFQAGADANSRAWTTDIQTYEDGTIVALWKARAGAFGSHTSGSNDHRVWYGKLDPSTGQWTTSEVAKAGASLFGGGETDYTGLGAIHPSDPNVLYISTEIDPVTNSNLPHHEIYKGVTIDNGATWSWTPITENSSYDNLRPIIPSWDANNTAVLWWRGSMSSSQRYDAAVVGIIDRNTEDVGLVTYFDASASNTTLADGSALTFSGPSPNSGSADGDWHLRTAAGNSGTVFTADELGSEDAPILKTEIASVEAGTYDVFAFFWSEVQQDWQIEAGLDQDELILFRIRGSQQAAAEDFSGVHLLDDGTRSLYRAYLGRVEIATNESIQVYINDSNGSGGQSVWYDGVGIANVLSTIALPGDYNNDGLVNLADYSVWRDNLGADESVLPAGSGDGSDTVDAGDYFTWKSNFGGTLSPVTSLDNAAVPEPKTCVLLSLPAVVCACRYRRAGN